MQVPLGCVSVSHPDTDLTPYDQQTSSSRTTYSMGGAIGKAAADLKRQLFEYAAELLEVSVNDLVLEEGRVAVRGSPSRSHQLWRGCAAQQSRQPDRTRRIQHARRFGPGDRTGYRLGPLASGCDRLRSGSRYRNRQDHSPPVDSSCLRRAGRQSSVVRIATGGLCDFWSRPSAIRGNDLRRSWPSHQRQLRRL